MPESPPELGAERGTLAPPNTGGTETAGLLEATLTLAGVPAETVTAGAEFNTSGTNEEALGPPDDAWRRAPTNEREYCPSGP